MTELATTSHYFSYHVADIWAVVTAGHVWDVVVIT